MIDLIFNKYLEMMNLEDQQGSRTDQYQVIAGNLYSFLEDNKNSLEESIEQEPLHSLSTKLIEWYNKDGDWPRRIVYVKSMLILAYVDGNQQKSHMEDRVKEFAGNAPFETFSKIDKKYLSMLIKNFPNNFKDSVLKDLRIFDLGKGYIPDEDRPIYVSAMLGRLPGLSDIDQKEEYMDAIVELKVANDGNFIEKLFNELDNLKSTDPDLVKKYARRRFFSSVQRKNLKETI